MPPETISQNADGFYRQLREEVAKKISNDKARLIFSTSLPVEPQFEAKYLDYLKKDDYLFGLYKKWVLGFNILPSGIDEHFYQLRAIILEKSIRDNKSMFQHFNEPALYFLVDMIWLFLKNIIDKNLLYWEIELPTVGYPFWNKLHPKKIYSRGRFRKTNCWYL